jgi:hypothetical protein
MVVVTPVCALVAVVAPVRVLVVVVVVPLCVLVAAVVTIFLR